VLFDFHKDAALASVDIEQHIFFTTPYCAPRDVPSAMITAML
jgi:hypothetical protein